MVLNMKELSRDFWTSSQDPAFVGIRVPNFTVKEMNIAGDVYLQQKDANMEKVELGPMSIRTFEIDFS